MKYSIVLVAAAFLCLVAFPMTTVGKNLKYWPKPIEGWPKPSELRKEMFMSHAQKYNYGESKVWKCTYSNGSSPVISVSYPTPPTPSTPSPSTPSNPSPSTPSTPSPSTPSTPSPPPPPTPSPSPTTPKTSPPPPTPSPPPPTPKTSPPPPTPSPPPPTPKTSPPPPTVSPPPPTPKQSPPPPVPCLPPPTPKESPSPPPSEQTFHPHPGHHHSHHHQNGWEHIDSCWRNMGQLGMCRMQVELTYHMRMFHVCKYCCNLIVNMRNECNDIAFGFFMDPFFLPLVRNTCHVNLY